MKEKRCCVCNVLVCLFWRLGCWRRRAHYMPARTLCAPPHYFFTLQLDKSRAGERSTRIMSGGIRVSRYAVRACGGWPVVTWQTFSSLTFSSPLRARVCVCVCVCVWAVIWQVGQNSVISSSPYLIQHISVRLSKAKVCAMLRKKLAPVCTCIGRMFDTHGCVSLRLHGIFMACIHANA